MTEFFRLKFRRGSKAFYAVQKIQLSPRRRVAWTLSEDESGAYRFHRIEVIPRLLRGADIFRRALMSGYSWEIIRVTERVMECGMEVFKSSGDSIRVRFRRRSQ